MDQIMFYKDLNHNKLKKNKEYNIKINKKNILM